MHDPLRPEFPFSPHRAAPAEEHADTATSHDTAPPQAQGGQSEPGQPESAAVQKFRSCRWRKATTPEHCGHPEVLPFAGTNGFVPESWCPDCQFYKLRRVLPRREY